MARKSGSFSLGGTLEILADAPADVVFEITADIVEYAEDITIL